MSSIQRILCPTDFSETAAKAVWYAAELAQGTGAELHLVHSFETVTSGGLLGEESPNAFVRDEMIGVLANSSLGDRIHRHVHAGEPGKVICWMAQKLACDLIVMGTHGRTGLKHLLLGSVAEYVVRHARCPVTTVRDRPLDEPPLTEPIVMPIKAPRMM